MLRKEAKHAYQLVDELLSQDPFWDLQRLYGGSTGLTVSVPLSEQVKWIKLAEDMGY